MILYLLIDSIRLKSGSKLNVKAVTTYQRMNDRTVIA